MLLHLNAIPHLLFAITPNSLLAVVLSKHYHSNELHRVLENWRLFDFYVTEQKAFLLGKKKSASPKENTCCSTEKCLNQLGLL